jgi:hypothetical protein
VDSFCHETVAAHGEAPVLGGRERGPHARSSSPRAQQ